MKHDTELAATAIRRLRIGYAPLSEDFSYPGDRRRFAFYARARGIEFRMADPAGSYDVVVVSQGGDLSRWARLQRNGARIIFDFVDSYLEEEITGIRPLLRGVAKFAFRQTRHLYLDYRKLLEEMCARSDAVICTNVAQRERIGLLNPNVHVILDIQSGATRKVKERYERGPIFNLAWEGLPGNVVTFREMADALRALQRQHSIALHLVTDLERAAALRHVGRLPTKRLIRSVLAGVKDVFLYEWNEEMLSTICTACDLAVVPIPLDDRLYAAKPESKLVLFWRMGLPVVTSATPAYVAVMNAAGLSMSCRTTDDWIEMLERYTRDEALREQAGRIGRAYAISEYSEARLLEKWDAVFESVL